MGVVRKLSPAIPLFVLLALIRLPYLNLPLDRDEGAYAYVGWIWLTKQGIPYLTVFAHKPPLTYLIYGLASVAGGNNFLPIRLIAFVYIMLTVFFYYFFVSKFSSRTTSVLGTLLVGFYLSSIRLEGTNFNTEVLMALPLLVFSYLVWRLTFTKKKKGLLAIFSGVFAAIAVLFKPVAGISIAFIVFWYLLYTKKFKDILFITLGFLIPTILVVGYFWINNATEALIRDLIFYNQQYTKAGLEQSKIFSKAGATGLLGYAEWLKKIPRVLSPFILFSIMGAIFAKNAKSTIWWISLILVATLWAGAKMGGSREFPHYYLPLVIGMGLVFALTIDKMIRQGQQAVVYFVTVFLLLWLVIPEFRYWKASPLEIQRKQFGSQGDWFYLAPQVAEWIRENISYTDDMLVWGSEPEIYFYSSRKSPYKYINFYAFLNSQDEWDEWLRVLTLNNPDLIVTYTNDPPTTKELDKFIDRTMYTKVKKIGTYMILRRKDAILR